MHVITLGGVKVEVVGPSTPRPADPGSEGVWETSRMALYTSVLMTDGSRWQVLSVPRRTGSGGVSVTLTDPSTLGTATYTVARQAVDTPIWQVGELPPPPPVVIDEGETDPTPPPPTPEVAASSDL